MILTIPQVLDATGLARLRSLLADDGAAWIDGQATAGYQGAPVKHNRQIDEMAPVATTARALVLAALETHPVFISGALPARVYPPMFNRYGPGMAFGTHVDGAIRLNPLTGQTLRTDLSATLFLNDPGDYDGGVLQIMDSYGLHDVKLAAGDMVLYPATSWHQVTAVTRGMRLACFFWVQSLIRDQARRAIAYDLDTAIQRLNHTDVDRAARETLIGCYHNLLRQWAET